MDVTVAWPGVLPALFACAGQTELIEAAKLLQVVEPTKDTQSSYRDWARPLQQWAGESQANLTRAMLAIAYVQAAAAGGWRPGAKRRPRRLAQPARLPAGRAGHDSLSGRRHRHRYAVVMAAGRSVCKIAISIDADVHRAVQRAAST